MNRWKLTEEVRNKYKPVIKDFLDKMESLTGEDVEKMDNEEFSLSFSDTKLNPYTLLTLLKKEFGYGNEQFSNSGWELNYLICINKSNISYPSTCERLCIHGCGMTFELKLTVAEFL